MYPLKPFILNTSFFNYLGFLFLFFIAKSKNTWKINLDPKAYKNPMLAQSMSEFIRSGVAERKFPKLNNTKPIYTKYVDNELSKRSLAPLSLQKPEWKEIEPDTSVAQSKVAKAVKKAA